MKLYRDYYCFKWHKNIAKLLKPKLKLNGKYKDKSQFYNDPDCGQSFGKQSETKTYGDHWESNN